MKKIFLIAALTCLTALGVGSAHATLSLSIASLDFNDGATVRFDGSNDKFSFTNATTGPGTGYSFTISGMLGRITGTYAIGAVTTVMTGLQSAPVTGSGTLDIFDGFDHLTADLNWNDGVTIGSSIVTFGLLNLAGTLNLTNPQYTGSNTSLQYIDAAGSGTVAAEFSFQPGKTLQQLKDGGINATSYSGSLSAVPIPGALLLLGAGLVRLVTYGRRKRGLA